MKGSFERMMQNSKSNDPFFSSISSCTLGI